VHWRDESGTILWAMREGTLPDRTEAQPVRELWARYKTTALKVLLAVTSVVLVLAQFVPNFGFFLERQKYLSIGVVIALLLLVLDTVLSPAAKAKEKSPRFPDTLAHTSDLSQLFPDLLHERRVTFDICSYSSETFYSVLTALLDQIAAGQTNIRELRIRLLVPDCQAPMGIPCLVDTGKEVPAYKRLLVQRSMRFIREFQNGVQRVNEAQPQVTAAFEARLHRLSPLFKFVILQEEVAYIGTYPIDRTPVLLGNREQMFYDFRGERAILARSAVNGASAGETVTFRSLTEWFESVWKIASPSEDGPSRD
jgi:hypothetical protein